MKLKAIAAAALTALALILIPAGARATTPPTTWTGVSHLTNRPDSGGNGTWATDTIDRTLVITQTSTGHYKATIRDAGTYVTLDGAFTPNQGGANAGLKVVGGQEGTIVGFAAYNFTASQLPQVAMIPATVDGTTGSTSEWYKVAFPAGTVFGGSGIVNVAGPNQWVWVNKDEDSIKLGGVKVSTQQVWIDSPDTNDGQATSGQGTDWRNAGNIVD